MLATPGTIDIFLDSVSGTRTESQLQVLSLKMREAFRTIQTYEADPRNWKAIGSEDDYVNRYRGNDIALQQVRSAHALQALRPLMSNAQLQRARTVLNSISDDNNQRDDVRNATRRAAGAF